MSVSAIIEAIEARLEAAGYTVNVSKLIDPQTDTLPLVTIHLVENLTISNAPLYTAELTLALEYWGAERLDQLSKIAEQVELLRNAVVKSPGVDMSDRLGGLANRVEHIKDRGWRRDRDPYTVETQIKIVY